MVEVEFTEGIWKGERARIQGYEWTAEKPLIARVLSGFLDPLGPNWSEEDPDFAVVEEAKKFLPLKVVKHDKPRV